MKIKAIVTALLLATSTAAIAAPYDNGPGFAPEVRDHRMMPPQPIESWSLLATGQLARGRATIQLAGIKVDKLKLEAQRTPLFVDKVILTFANGRTQTIELNQMVSARSALVLDVDAKLDHNTGNVNGRGQWRSRNRTGKLTAVTVVGSGRGFRAGASFKLLAL